MLKKKIQKHKSEEMDIWVVNSHHNGKQKSHVKDEIKEKDNEDKEKRREILDMYRDTALAFATFKEPNSRKLWSMGTPKM